MNAKRINFPLSKVLITLALFFIVGSSFAGPLRYGRGPNYYHGIGFQYNYGFFRQVYDNTFIDFDGLSVVSAPGVMYKSTIGLSDNFAISAYPMLGFSLTVDSYAGTSGSIGLELPVNAELHFGEMDEGDFFLGAGLSYSLLGNSDAGGGSIFGPQIAAGGQFEISRKVFGIRGAYTFGLNKTKVDAGTTLTKDSRGLVSLGFYYVIDN